MLLKVIFYLSFLQIALLISTSLSLQSLSKFGTKSPSKVTTPKCSPKDSPTEARKSSLKPSTSDAQDLLKKEKVSFWLDSSSSPYETCSGPKWPITRTFLDCSQNLKIIFLIFSEYN